MKDKYMEEYAFRKGYRQGQEEGFDKGFIKGLYQLMSGDVSYNEAYNKILLSFGYDFDGIPGGFEHDIKGLFDNMNEDPNRVLYAYDRFDAGYSAACFDILHGIVSLKEAEAISEGEIPLSPEKQFDDSDCFAKKEDSSDAYEDVSKNVSDVIRTMMLMINTVPEGEIKSYIPYLRELVSQLKYGTEGWQCKRLWDIWGSERGNIEIGVLSEDELGDVEYGTEEGIELAIFKSTAAQFFKAVLPLINKSEFGERGELVELVVRNECLESENEVLSDNLYNAFVAVKKLGMVPNREIKDYLGELALVLEHNIIGPKIKRLMAEEEDNYNADREI